MLAHYSPINIRERIRMAKVRKFMGQESLTVEGEKRSKQTIKWRKNNFSSLGDQCPTSIWAMATLEKFPQIYRWAWGFILWNIPVVTLGQLSQLYLFPTLVQLLPTHWLARVGNREGLDAPWALPCKSQNIAITTVLVINLNHSIIWAVQCPSLLGGFRER